MIHERKHSKGFSKKDVFMDVFNDDLEGVKMKYYKFMITHPKTWVGFLPLSKVGGRWIVDPLMAIYDILLILVIVGVLMFAW